MSTYEVRMMGDDLADSVTIVAGNDEDALKKARLEVMAFQEDVSPRSSNFFAELADPEGNVIKTWENPNVA